MKQTKLTDSNYGTDIEQRLGELDLKIEYLIEALHDFRYRKKQTNIRRAEK